MSEELVAAMLSRLTITRGFPKYELERGIDPFMSVFLGPILDAALGGTHTWIAQEFPLKKANNRQSTNIDYVFLREQQDATPAVWRFVELKTDSHVLDDATDRSEGQAVISD